MHVSLYCGLSNVVDSLLVPYSCLIQSRPTFQYDTPCLCVYLPDLALSWLNTPPTIGKSYPSPSIPCSVLVTFSGGAAPTSLTSLVPPAKVMMLRFGSRVQLQLRLSLSSRFLFCLIRSSICQLPSLNIPPRPTSPPLHQHINSHSICALNQFITPHALPQTSLLDPAFQLHSLRCSR
jgi:hypothetical protein